MTGSARTGDDGAGSASQRSRSDGAGRRAQHRTPTKAWALRRVAGVLAAGAVERVRGVHAAGPADVPRSPDDITPQWLTAVLCRGAPQAHVRAVTPVGASSGTTTRRALQLTYDDAGSAAVLPTQIFVKCTTGLAQRLMLGLGGLIHGEPGFYSEVRPRVEIEAPIGYFGAVDPRSWRSVVVMEDVARTRQACFWQPATRITRRQIEDLLSNTAAWHGALWNSPRLGGWRWLKTPAEQMRLIDALLGMANRLPAGAERARHVIPLSLRDRQADIYAGLGRSMQIMSEGPRTYLHGDLHVANTYLTRDSAMGVADWQVGLQGSWAYDYAYLVASALEIEERRAWEGDLLDFYLERLAAAGGAVLRRDRAWLAYRQATFYPYFAWTYTIGRSRLQPKFQPDEVSLTMIRRIAAAIADLDSLDAVGR